MISPAFLCDGIRGSGVQSVDGKNGWETSREEEEEQGEQATALGEVVQVELV
jgi:hypothetical protein